MILVLRLNTDCFLILGLKYESILKELYIKVNYIQYDRYPNNFHNLSIKAVNKVNYKGRPNTEEERQMLDLYFGDTPEKLREEYLDIYDGIQTEILSTTRVDDNSDLSSTYLRRVDATRASKSKVEETFPISQ